MTPEQAIQVLRDTTPHLNVPLSTHMAVQQAIQTLEALGEPEPPAKPGKV